VGNVILMPAADYDQQRDGPIHWHQRLGVLLKDYNPEAT
jgi:hypothetical protein